MLSGIVFILPTLLDYARIEKQENYSGLSLLDILDGQVSRKAIYGQYEEQGYASYMALTKEYKYIYSAPDQQEYLFDRTNDPEETRNKAGNPLYQEKTREMRSQILQHFRDEGYLLPLDPLDGNSWRVYPKKDMPADPDAYLLFQDPESSIPRIPGYETDSNARKFFQFNWYDHRHEKSPGLVPQSITAISKQNPEEDTP